MAEIETALLDLDGVKDVVVVAQEEPLGEQRLVAYVVPASPAPLSVSGLRRLLQEKLPAYMLPTAFVTLPALPRTATGKVDRRTLPAPGHSRPELESGFVAPQDAFARQLTRIWEDLLGIKPVGMQDDFFELGGHSLLAVQLCARIEKQMGAGLPLATLFQRPTLAHLAHYLRHQGEEASGALPFEMPREHAVDWVKHPIMHYLPSSCHPLMRSTYHRLKQSSIAQALRRLHIRHGKTIVRRFFSYPPWQLEQQLRKMGLTAGDTLLMQSAFHVLNGFEGTPDQVIECVLHIIGASGNLLMLSLPYTRSTAAYLQAGVLFDVKRTMSAMGVLTEIFRHKPGVVRSVNPAHPFLALGPGASWLITEHENTMYSCGRGSPFEKLVHVQAKALFFDVSLHRMTFFHYLEDLFRDSLPVKLYEETPVESSVIDTNGKRKTVKTYTFSSAARQYRNMRNFYPTLKKETAMRAEKIGNTRLIVLQLQQVVECAQKMVRSGTPLWNI
jgi:aminoglycoside 3-N-acetyltransferase